MSGWFTTLVDCRLCKDGELIQEYLVISDETGKILNRTGYIGGEIADLNDGIVAPGFLELHTNGVNGFHYTHFEDEVGYTQKLEKAAQYYVTQGVTGFWATIPTVSADEFQQVSEDPAPRRNGRVIDIDP